MNNNSNLNKETLNKINEYAEDFSHQLYEDLAERNDFEDEMKSNLKSSIEDLISEGYSEKNATTIAFKRFGDLSNIKEDIKDLHKEVNNMHNFLNYLIKAIFLCIIVICIGMLIYHKEKYIFIPALIFVILLFVQRKITLNS